MSGGSGVHTGLAVAVAHARRQRDAALAVLSQARAQQNGAQGQLDQLQMYASETETRWASQARIAASPELMHHHYQFMGRLYQALEMQRAVIGQHVQRVEGCMGAVRATELRLCSLQKVVQKQAADTARLVARREQKEVDEFAARQTQRLALSRSEGAP